MNMWFRYSIHFIALLFLFGFLSCSEGENELEKGLLQQDSMVIVMADIQLAESILKIRSNDDGFDWNNLDPYETIFQKHQVTKEQLQNSLEYYSNHPEQLEEIYDQVIVRLSELQAGYQNKDANKSK